MKGFTLTELLVAVFLTLILSAFGLRYYQKQKIKMRSTWAKAELSEIYKIMKITKDIDGRYHQFLYKMGYRPKGKIYGLAGILADSSTLCCDQYPLLGSDPCRIGSRSGFSHYNCKNGLPDTALTNIQICESPNYDLICNKEPEDLITSFNERPGGAPSCFSNPSCDCDTFAIGADMSTPNAANTFLKMSHNGAMETCN